MLRADGVEAEHKIELTLSSAPHRVDRIESVHINARYYPDCGWGAFVWYSAAARSALPYGDFGMRLAHVSQPRRHGSTPHFVLDVPSRNCEARIREGNCTYVFGVALEVAGLQPISSVDEQVRASLASPEKFHDFAVNELKALEAKVREDVESGAAWVGVVDSTNVRSDNPPRQRPPRQGELPTAELKAKALDALLTEIERRRGLVQGHYQAMFESAHRAIPLYECISSGTRDEQGSSSLRNVKQPN